MLTALKIIFAEIADLAGQLIRNDYGSDTLSNVLAQAKAYFTQP